MDQPELPAPEEMPSTQVVRSALHRGPIDAWSLVLLSQGISHHIVERAVVEPASTPLKFIRQYLLVVEPAQFRRAAVALSRTEAEDAERALTPDALPPDGGISLVPLLVCVALGGFFLFTGPRAGNAHWFAVGSSDAEAIMKGAWYRAATGLTLHADAMHVAGNIVAMLIFLGAASRWLGGGVALFLTLMAGFLGNLSTAAFFGSGHNSVGASTATFAALGVLGGLQARHRVKFGWWHRSKRIGRGWRAVAACLGLFAMLGVGGPEVDMMAHATGLAWGLAFGLAAASMPEFKTKGNVLWGSIAVGFIAVCWARALS